MKKVMFCIFSILFSHPIFSSTDIINKKQALNYINQVIDNLFDLDNEILNNDMINFKKNTKNILLDKLGYYPNAYASNYMYNKHDLKEGIYSEVLLLIEQKTKKYAYKYLENLNLPRYDDSKKIVKKVLEKIRNKVSVTLSNNAKYGSKNQLGIMADFIGSNLKLRVNTLVNAEIRKDSPMQRPQIHKHVCKPMPVYADAVYVKPVVPICAQNTDYLVDYVPGYMVEVADVYEPVYQPVVLDYNPGFTFGAGIDFGKIFGNGSGFLDFQINL